MALNVYSYIIKGLLHWYRWILTLVGISTDARKLASLDIPASVLGYPNSGQYSPISVQLPDIVTYSIWEYEGKTHKKCSSRDSVDRMGPVKRICVFEHSVMSNFNCACPAIQRGQGSGFLSEGSSWLTACMSEQRRFWRDCADAQARLNLRCSHRL